jgi:hypothetical protein
MKPGAFKPRTKRLARHAWIARGARINPVNRERRAKNFERAYGSVSRVAFVRALPCLITGQSPCDNVHVVGGGAGRKADAEWTVPLIREKHEELHRIGVASFEAKYADELRQQSLAWHAQHTDRLWRAFGGGDQR